MQNQYLYCNKVIVNRTSHNIKIERECAHCEEKDIFIILIDCCRMLFKSNIIEGFEIIQTESSKSNGNGSHFVKKIQKMDK